MYKPRKDLHEHTQHKKKHTQNILVYTAVIQMIGFDKFRSVKWKICTNKFFVSSAKFMIHNSWLMNLIWSAGDFVPCSMCRGLITTWEGWMRAQNVSVVISHVYIFSNQTRFPWSVIYIQNNSISLKCWLLSQGSALMHWMYQIIWAIFLMQSPLAQSTCVTVFSTYLILFFMINRN